MKSSNGDKSSQKKTSKTDPVNNGISQRHLFYGWSLLVLFMALGVVLEALHGFKTGFYLDVSNETRRLMWRLAHAHGTFMGLVQIAFAYSLTRIPSWDAKVRHFSSLCLNAASVLLPLGFFLGGLAIRGGDPGLGILLVPLGALLLLATGATTALAIRGEKEN